MSVLTAYCCKVQLPLVACCLLSYFRIYWRSAFS